TPRPGRKAPFPPLLPGSYIDDPGRMNNQLPAGPAVSSSFRMLNHVYNRRILELAGNIPRLGRLPLPGASATAHSELCGSAVHVDDRMEGDKVTDSADEGKVCALGEASSAIMARKVVGASAGELGRLREHVRKMVKENGSPPAEERWADIAVLEPVR